MRRHAIVLVLTLAAIAAVALLAPAPAAGQVFGVGGSLGWTNDVSAHDAQFDSFKFGTYSGWFEYRMEDTLLLRLTGGTLKTKQTSSGALIQTPVGSTTVPELGERVNYGLVSASYRFWEGFFTSALFGGIGGYGIHPADVDPAYAGVADRHETVFGWHLGTEGEFTVTKNVGIDLRLTYHNVSAHPHRQFVAAEMGATWRF
ncbi:MAG TPA: outer membrane beta-barrel protein [Thermoanaerobaculia bacterium]|nr:outer membrane beta-barrel protein [Thermoanaerobaculia bacterium]